MAPPRPTSRRAAGVALALATAVASAAGCGSDDPAEERTLTVYAAASLRTSFERVGEELERRHDGVRVELAFGGSSDLVAQVLEGAPADVVALADTATMERLTAEGLHAGEPQVFATNTLEIAVAPGNPARVASLADLAADDLRVVVCAPEVPCGAAAARVQEVAGVGLRPVSEEQSVTDVLAKVTSGEADAGLVYVTDVIAAGDAVDGVPFPEAAAAVNSYPIVALEAGDLGLAQELVDLVLGPTGRAILEEAGFAQP